MTPLRASAEKTCSARQYRLELTEEDGYQLLCGDPGDGSYTIRLSRRGHPDWRMAAGDFGSFYEAQGMAYDFVMSQQDMDSMLQYYKGHRYDDPFLRPGEPEVLVHSTPGECWASICQDGRLKSWNVLKGQGALGEQEPIGAGLGDPEDFQRYIMFGSGMTGEIIVSSKQKGRICMDPCAEYRTGARLYFDGKQMARDRVLLRDGCHIKVRDYLPLEPYLLWAATWDQVGLDGPLSTPKEFAERADRLFAAQFAKT
ncbi:MAG: hypothetical protein K2P33_09255 [Acutalibacter sp.]|nr:hypothetical protein [Acutalibacter sp.]